MPIRMGDSGFRPTLARVRLAAMALALLVIGGCPSSSKPALPDAQAAKIDAAESPKPAPASASAAAAAGPPAHEATRAEAAQALHRLEEWVKAGATDATNPWAMAHGLVAFGKSLKASNGRPVIDVIVTDFVEKKKLGGKELYFFPPESPAQTPVEPHKDLLVKSMLEAGVPLTQRFPIKGGRTVTLDRLLADAELRFAIPADPAGYQDYAWSVSAFILGRTRERRIRTSKETIPLEAIEERTMAELEEEQRFLEAPMSAGRPELVEKRKQGIFAHTCGGLHLVQAALLGASDSKNAELLKRARHQLDIVIFRWQAERRIYKDAIRQQPQYRWLLLVQELKFYGHVLETLALAKGWGVLDRDDALARQARSIAGDLADTVAALEPAYAGQKELRERTAQTYYDLIGDGCHAIRGLSRGLGAFFPD